MRNIILKTQAWLNGIALLLSVCMIDSESWIPAIVFCVTLAWLTLFAYANEWQKDPYEEQRRRPWR